MKKLITVCQIVVFLAVLSAIAIGADQVINYTEKMVGAGHPTLADTLNRALLVDHETDGTHSASTIGSSQITDGAIVNADINASAAIDATKIGTGGVTSTEFGYIGTLTSDAQTQITLRATLAAPTFTGTVTVTGIVGDTGSFTSLTRGTVSDTEFSYLDGVTSAIQTQLAAKQVLDNGTFTGEVSGSQFSSNCDPGAGECGSNTMNTTDPTGVQLAAGLAWYDGTNNIPKQRNGDNTVTLQGLTAGTSGASKFSKCTVIDNALTTSDYPIEKFPQAITITNIKVYVIGGTNVIGGLDECTGTNGVCSSVTAVDADITGTAGNEVSDDASLTNPGIAAGNWIQWHTTSVSGTNTSLSVCFFYTLDTSK